MIKYTQGNLLEATADALVNTVNEMGVMGKGIAMMFREAFPISARAYEAAAKNGEIRVGHVFVTPGEKVGGPSFIVHFPTKKHWRNPSKLAWVRDGLADLVRVVSEREIRSIALPPLGCGNGGLQWSEVRLEIESALSALPDVDVLVFQPTDAYLAPAKEYGLQKLTPARALMAEMVRRYSVLGLECTILEVQKLAWFLSRAIMGRGLADPLKLTFVALKYGPYADRLRHLLDGLDGSYLHAKKRLSDASPFDLIWFDEDKREAVEAYLKEDAAKIYGPALEETARVIDGFESPLGMELLATVDWLLSMNGTAATVSDVRSALRSWPGGKEVAARKLKLFDERLIDIALKRLSSLSRIPGAATSTGAISVN